MDYEEFLRTFSVTEEVMKVNQDEFDYMYYTYGLNGLPNAEGKKAVDKKVLLIEPLNIKRIKSLKTLLSQLILPAPVQVNLLRNS